MRRNVIVADRPQHQPGTGAVEKQPDADDQRQRQIDEAVLAEQDPPDQRNIGQAGDVEMRRRRDALADEAGADQAGQPDAEDGQRQPVATWLTASPSVIAAKTSDSSVPAIMPQSAPKMIEPVSQAPAETRRPRRRSSCPRRRG